MIDAAQRSELYTAEINLRVAERLSKPRWRMAATWLTARRRLDAARERQCSAWTGEFENWF